ncbi:hypothetical protein FJT64_016152 [Amphibalanus amphitrite]|uniref:Uncharacterized protein n=1 Tax=Amphibalanus amphitrite TaxID=1232801 RepID=A0A6A4X777_AMPAM|nr:hypothetical protein FJT64_016152 [Amphibalanus amphitrite]
MFCKNLPISRKHNRLKVADRPVRLGHVGSQKVHQDGVPLLSWEPYFCVLLQDEQTLTAYRSEEMAAPLSADFPGHTDTASHQEEPEDGHRASGGAMLQMDGRSVWLDKNSVVTACSTLSRTRDDDLRRRRSRSLKVVDRRRMDGALRPAAAAESPRQRTAESPRQQTDPQKMKTLDVKPEKRRPTVRIQAPEESRRAPPTRDGRVGGVIMGLQRSDSSPLIRHPVPRQEGSPASRSKESCARDALRRVNTVHPKDSMRRMKLILVPVETGEKSAKGGSTSGDSLRGTKLVKRLSLRKKMTLPLSPSREKSSKPSPSPTSHERPIGAELIVPLGTPTDEPLENVREIGDSLFLDLPRVRLDGGGKAFRKQWGYDLAPPPTLLEEEEDEDEDGEDDVSETQSLREDFFGRQSALVERGLHFAPVFCLSVCLSVRV